MTRGVPKPDRATVGFRLTFHPVDHALLALEAARRDVSLRALLHGAITKEYPMTDPERTLTAPFGSPVLLNDGDLADKVTGTFGHRAEAAADAQHERLAQLATRGTSITNRPDPRAGHPTLNRAKE